MLACVCWSGGLCVCLCVTMCMGMWVWVCRSEGTMWEDCANRIIRTSTIEKAILLVTDPEKMTQEELARQVVKASTLHHKPKGGAAWPGWQTSSGPRARGDVFSLPVGAGLACSLNSRVAQLYPRATPQCMALDARRECITHVRRDCHWMRAINLAPCPSWPHADDDERL